MAEKYPGMHFLNPNERVLGHITMTDIPDGSAAAKPTRLQRFELNHNVEPSGTGDRHGLAVRVRFA